MQVLFDLKDIRLTTNTLPSSKLAILGLIYCEILKEIPYNQCITTMNMTIKPAKKLKAAQKIISFFQRINAR